MDECNACGGPVDLTAEMRKRAGQHCLSCHRQRESVRVARWREKNPEKVATVQNYCTVSYSDCYVCGRTTARRRAPKKGVRTRCGSESCEKRYNADRMNAYARRRRAEGVDVYAPYREDAKKRQKERIRTGQELPKRQRYPEKYKAHDQKRRAIKAGADAETFSTKEICERDGWVCGICGGPVPKDARYPNPRSASLDHIIPLSKGGGHTRANSRCSHLACNVRRGAD